VAQQEPTTLGGFTAPLAGQIALYPAPSS
jgi:hypothetical protein